VCGAEIVSAAAGIVFAGDEIAGDRFGREDNVNCRASTPSTGTLASYDATSCGDCSRSPVNIASLAAISIVLEAFFECPGERSILRRRHA